MTNEEIIKEFKKGHKGEELMEVAEAEAEIQIALENQKKDILEKVEKMKETPANRGMFMWVQGYNQAIKALKKHLT